MKTAIKNLITLSLTVVATLGTATLSKANDDQNKQSTILSSVKKVNKINVSGNVQVILIQSEVEGVKVYNNYYSKNALVQQKENELRISSFEKQPLTVVVYVSNLYEINATGNATVKTVGNFKTLYLEVYLKDNATANLNTSTISLFTNINGKASLSLSGKSDEYTAVLGSVGTVNLDQFAAVTTNIQSKSVAFTSTKQHVAQLPIADDTVNF